MHLRHPDGHVFRISRGLEETEQVESRSRGPGVGPRPGGRETTDGDDLQELVQRNRITDVINRLFVSTDSRNWAAVKACFAPEVLFDMSSLGAGPAVRLPPEAIAAAWEAGLKPIEAIHHQSGNFFISSSGTQATASCYGIAYHYRRTESGRNTRVFVGAYDFHLVLHDEWRIDAFRFDLKFVDGNATLEKEPSA
jgi:hypothetical protein